MKILGNFISRTGNKVINVTGRVRDNRFTSGENLTGSGESPEPLKPPRDGEIAEMNRPKKRGNK